MNLGRGGHVLTFALLLTLSTQLPAQTTLAHDCILATDARSRADVLQNAEEFLWNMGPFNQHSGFRGTGQDFTNRLMAIVLNHQAQILALNSLQKQRRQHHDEQLTDVASEAGRAAIDLHVRLTQKLGQVFGSGGGLYAMTSLVPRLNEKPEDQSNLIGIEFEVEQNWSEGRWFVDHFSAKIIGRVQWGLVADQIEICWNGLCKQFDAAGNVASVRLDTCTTHSDFIEALMHEHNYNRHQQQYTE